MVMRDRAPRETLGFGVSGANLPVRSEQDGDSPDSGVVARYLQDRPLQKFFATTAATILGATAAGSLIRKQVGLKGMKHVAKAAAQSPDGHYARFLKSYRDLQRTFDEYGGISVRKKGLNDFGLGGKQFDDPTLDEIKIERGFFVRPEGDDPAAEWMLRDEIRTRMIRQGRRLPYEIPAAYVAQRTISDPLLGNETDDVNWTNPLDIVGDFAEQSMKNLAFAFVPFEGATGAVQHGWRKSLMAGANSNYSGFQGIARNTMIDVNRTLNQLGQDFSSLTTQAVKYSRNTTGAVANATVDSAAKQRGLIDTLNLIRKSGVREYANKIKSGEEAFTPLGQAFDLMRGIRTRLGSELDAPGRDFKSPFEKFADATAALRYQGADITEETMRAGGLWRGVAQREYRNLVRKNLIDAGATEDVATKFTNLAGFNLPGAGRSNVDVTNRLRFGGRLWGDSAEESLGKRIKPVFGDEGDAITQNISNAMSRADAAFDRMRPEIDRKVSRAWGELNTQIGRHAKQELGMKKASYADFSGKMTASSREFLIRRSAERLGVETIDSAGRQLSTAQLRRGIAQMGVDPGDTSMLRGYLVSKGDISKPWRPFGGNAFGFTPVSVGEALDSGMLKDKANLPDIKRFANSIRDADWDTTTLNRLKLGGVYRTASGDIMDFNKISGPLREFGSRVAEEFKLPFIQLRPFQMNPFGRNTSEDLLQFSTARNPFLPKGDQDAYGYMWMKSGRSGRVARMDMGPDNTPTTTMLSGKYKSISTGQSKEGLTLRMAIGQTGRYADRDKPRGKTAEFLGIDDYQPDSLIDWAKRLKNRKTDINNPAKFAELYKKHGFKGMQSLSYSSEEIAKASDGMFQFWRSQLFSKNLTRAVRKGGNKYSRLTEAFTVDGKNVFDMSSDELKRQVKRVIDMDIPEDLAPDAQRMLTKARSNLVGSRWADTTNLNAITGGAGSHRLSDQLMMDLMRFNTIEKTALSGRSYGNYISEVMSEIDDLSAQGLIGSAEAAQARTVAGSMNQIYKSIESYVPELTAQDNNLKVLSSLLDSAPGVGINAQMQKVMDDTANYGTFGVFQRRAKKMFGVSKNEFDGTTINPFGDDRVFVPDFATAAGRDPKRAIASAFGFTTWSDPEAFSNAGFLPSHLVNRVNDALSTFNMRISPNTMGGGTHKGPLDLLGRGMVGKRMLPLVAGGATALAVDRTAGGYLLNERDANGERIYQPLVLGAAATGVAHAQVAMAGVLPGGQTAEEKREEIFEGDVAVRRGRWWPLGKTPWGGGKVEYYRPSWYRRFMNAPQYTDQTFGSPMERLAFGYDFSPLRPFDPYRFEREHYEDRPYPLTGDYFSGPWGPITPMLNATVGKILKPQREMHKEEMQFQMARYQPAGEFGMAPPSVDARLPAIGGGSTGGALPGTGQYVAAAGTPAYASGSTLAGDTVMAANAPYIAAAGTPNATSRSQLYNFGVGGSPTDVTRAMPPARASGLSEQLKDVAYRTQEFAGIYGFGFGAVREALGYGTMEYEDSKPILAQAGQAYGASRQFWDWNLGGLGDFPTPLEGEYANLEASEIIRRFVPKPRSQNLVNPIRNTMPEWLPGSGYFLNLKSGDPYVKIPDGELRLPGTAYERFNTIQGDGAGGYGLIDRFRVLADVAPYSDQFRKTAAELRASGMSSFERQIYDETMARVEKVKTRHEFSEYEHQDEPAFSPARMQEWLLHRDTYINNKFFPHRSAVEDWERNYVYGASFPQWQNPIRDFIKPMAYKAADRNGLMGAASFATLGHLMGASREAKAIGRLVGGTFGGIIGTASSARETITGNRFIPKERKREMAVEEYADILEYTRGLRGFNMAQQQGDASAAQYFEKIMRGTLYGADLSQVADPMFRENNIEKIARLAPKRKREHVEQFLQETNPETQERILETSGRLERRLYQAAWGYKVEARPDLGDYFEEHELPGPDWMGWDPSVSMEQIKIKMFQQQGINMSQMGYYPQQVAEANLMNPSYPDFNSPSNGRAEIERLMDMNNVQGSVRVIRTPFPGVNVDVRSGG